ncbi:sensitivity to high expression protein she9 [Tulasnella sp. 332]|nr:sensitivity to high expression protein she9 [Tulasnella sp. 332]
MSQNRLVLLGRPSLLCYSISQRITRRRWISTSPVSSAEDPLPSSKRLEGFPQSGSSPGLIPQWKGTVKQALDRLQIWRELNRELLRSKVQTFSSNASVGLQTAGAKLNVVTGYHEIEALKKQVVDIEKRIADLRQAAKDAKIAYELAVAERSSGQREVNDLLQRKSSWNEADVTRFTTLVRQDHVNEQTEISTKQNLANNEEAVEREFNDLMRAILNRYHEEQVWSDKIRSASTYGSLLALGLNVVVFVLAIVLVEPYKRKRLAQTFEKRIEEISKENKEMIEVGMAGLTEHFARQEIVLSQIAGVALQPPPPTVIAVPTSHTSELDKNVGGVPDLSNDRTTKSNERKYMEAVGSVLAGGLIAMAYTLLGKS